MSKRKKRARGHTQGQVEPTKPSAPFNNPFGVLSELSSELPPPPRAPRPSPSDFEREDTQRASLGVLEGCGKVVVQQEKRGRAGKTITRITGLPVGQLDSLAKRMKSALGCGATREGDDLLLLGTLVDRALGWLEGEGAKRVVVSGGGRKKKSKERSHQTAPRTPTSSSGARGGKSGHRRANLTRGLEVDIVLKKDQSTGALTRGVIHDILTRSATHPHGIKVRLTDGSVGRVKNIIG